MTNIRKFLLRLVNFFIIIGLCLGLLLARTSTVKAAWGDTYADYGLESTIQTWCESTWNSSTSISISCHIKNINPLHYNITVWDSWVRFGTSSDPKTTYTYDSGDLGSSRGGLAYDSIQNSHTYTINGLTPGTQYYFVFIFRMVWGGPWYWTDVQSVKFTPGWPVLSQGAHSIGTTTGTLNATLTSPGTAAYPITLNGRAWPASLGWNPSIDSIDLFAQTSTSPSNAYTVPTAFSVSLGNLKAGTTYNYNLSATGSSMMTNIYGQFTTSGLAMSVIAKPHTSLGNTTVTLNGLLSTLGSAPNATVSFQYMPLSSTNWYTAITANAGSLSMAGTFTAAVTGLTGGTAYKWRAVATHPNYGTFYSNTAYFTTTGASSTSSVSTDSFNWEDPGHNEATMYGTLHDMEGYGSTSVWFKYGQTESWLNLSTNSQSKFATGSFSVSNVECSSLSGYVCGYFQACSTYACGEILSMSGGSSEPPGNLILTTSTATNISEAGATLNGRELNNEDMKYYFEIGSTPGTYTITTEIKLSTSTYCSSFPCYQSLAMEGLAANTTYYYRIAGYPIACQSNCESDYGSEVSFTTLKSSQSPLAINTPSSLTYGSTAQLSTSGGSGSGAVTYTAAGSGCSVSGSTLSVTNASGTCSVSATKAADASYNAISSTQVVVSLLKANQATLSVSAPASVTYGSTSELGINGGSGSGAVIYNAGTSTGCSILGSTLSVTNASGGCAVSASKAADDNYLVASTSSVSITLVKANQATLSITTPASLTYGSTYILGTTGGSGTGVFSYSAAGSTGCSVSGSTLSVTNASGSCSVSASKAGDDNYNIANSSSAGVTLNKASQATLSITSPATLTFGSTYTLGTTGGSGTGAVTFSAGASTGCAITGATLSVTLVSGTCVVNATKLADDNYLVAVSSEASVTLLKATPAISITSKLPSPSVTGQAYTINFTVTHSAGTPTGSAEVNDGSGTLAGKCTSALSAGSGSCSITSTSGSFDSLSITYDGDVQFTETSQTFLHTVNKADSILEITATSSATTVTGEPYTISVLAGAVNPGVGTPTGSVTVTDAESNTCEILLSAGAGSCALKTFTIGEKTITATYSGDDDFNSNSDTVDHTVLIADSTTTITSDLPDPSAQNENATFKADVAPIAPATGFPAGTVGFYEGTTLLCSGVLSSGKVSCDYDALILGDHTLNALYDGDPAAYKWSESDDENHNVQLIELDDNATSTSFKDIGNFSNLGLVDTFVYTLQTTGRLCTPTNGAGNTHFEISNITLQRKPATIAGTYSICVQSEDTNGGLIQGVFEIIINNPPSLIDISLDHHTVSTTQINVGTLAATDGWDPQVFTLESEGVHCSSTNSSGNAYFEISGTTLKRISSTPAGEYTICVQVKDANDEIAQIEFLIAVTEPPAALGLSRKTVSTSQTNVGKFNLQHGQSVFDFYFSLTGEYCGLTSGADNDKFSIEDDILKRKPATPEGIYKVCAEVEDANGLTTQKNFIIDVTEPPSDIILTNTTVSTSQILVGTLITVDGQFLFDYTLENTGGVCNAENGVDNSLFSINGSGFKRNLTTTPGIYTVCIQTTDANEEIYQKAFSLMVAFEQPSVLDWDISLTSNVLIDGDQPGTLAGTMISSLPETTYELIEESHFPDSALFDLTPQGILTINFQVNYLQKQFFPLRILATAPDGSKKYLDVVIRVMKNGLDNGALAIEDSASVMTTDKVVIDVLSNDLMSTGATEWAFHQIVEYPMHGEAKIGSIIYTPESGWTGDDRLTYRACDNLNFCVTAAVLITVTPLPLPPLTGFPAGEITKLSLQPSTNTYNKTNDLTIEIPKLGIDTQVVGIPVSSEGWDITWLGNDVGWLNGSAYPTWNGNSVLTGHLYDSNGQPGVFKDLNQLKWGDKVIILIGSEKFTFEVQEVISLVRPNDLKTIMVHREQPWLTLVTCQGYDPETKTYRYRYIVRAVLVKVE